MAVQLKEYRSYFSVLSLNCQSIHSKFDSLQILVEDLKQHDCVISAICLQETWLDDDSELSYYNIPGYTCVSQGKYCSAHGGLVIYIHNTINYDLNILSHQFDTHEGIFLKVLNKNNNKDMYIGNVYRPPRHNDSELSIQNFIDELSPTLDNITRSGSNIILTGDFNIDLVKLMKDLEQNVFFSICLLLDLYQISPYLHVFQMVRQLSLTMSLQILNKGITAFLELLFLIYLITYLVFPV